MSAAVHGRSAGQTGHSEQHGQAGQAGDSGQDDVAAEPSGPEISLVDPLDVGPTRRSGAQPARIAKRVTSFTRRGSRLTDRLADAMDAHAAQYVLDPPRAAGETTVDPSWELDVEATFGRHAPLVVEVGSGHGEQIVSLAATHPEIDFLALEVWLPGIARLVEYAAGEGVTNVRVLPADAALALRTALPAGRVSEVWTFFPDPWRKNRHHKRRIVQEDFAATIARLLVDGGHWRLATDWANYALHMRAVLRASPFFVPAPEDTDGDATRPTWADADVWSPRYARRIMTHFEARGERAGRGARDLAAVRVPRAEQPDALVPFEYVDESRGHRRETASDTETAGAIDAVGDGRAR